MKHTKEKAVLKERKRLLNFIRGRVSNLEDAEDILQDVFFQFFDGYGTVNSIEKATAWLFKVARNKIIDRYRKLAVRPQSVSQLGAADDEDDAPLMLVDILPDLNGSPEDAYFKTMIWEEITYALEQLPEEQKNVFVMQEIEGMGFKEIAEISNTPVNTLISRKRYAVMALRKHLQTLYNEI